MTKTRFTLNSLVGFLEGCRPGRARLDVCGTAGAGSQVGEMPPAFAKPKAGGENGSRPYGG
ncbi:MAG TPA: hypothetical protein VG672_21015 [Bryobacteraceae bacterium]|nr:hypothetical protein [Bryobacteraceae bacterium]